MRVTDFLLGKPLATEEDEGERVGPVAGIGVLGLDALASSSYGPEALLTVLLPLGALALHYTLLLTAIIIGLLVIIALSYRQTIDAYPNGGGAYTVVKENLGTAPSLFAAAALSLDYLLNVAVAISAGAGALVSALPALLPHTLAICLGILVLLTLVNLRGVRATGFVFMLPTYLFLGSLFVVIGIGVFQTVRHGGHPIPVVAPPHAKSAAEAASIWLLLRAFANGCTAMTGVEAVSNAVPIFRDPQAKNAGRTLVTIIVCLAVLLAGIAFLCRSYGVTATPPGEHGYQSVLSLVAAATIGRGALYYVVITSVIAVLALSANTSFADFPRVCKMLASDRFLPEPLVHRGRRLAFSHGIVVLAIFSGILLVVFGGVTDRLIPLFAIGALLAFTASQAGMVAHWRKQSSRHARRSLILNGIGVGVTGLTASVVFVSKFTEGAWITAVLIAGMMLLFRQIHRHYDFVARATATDASLAQTPAKPPIAVVPVRRWDAPALKAMRFALSFAPEVKVVQVLTGDRDVDNLTDRWHALAVEPSEKQGLKAPELIVRTSEYRRLFAPLHEIVCDVARDNPDRHVAVVVPELVELRWYHSFLHNHTATLMTTLLLLRGNPQIVVITMPFYLRQWMPERRRLRILRERAIARWLTGRGRPSRA